APYATIPGGRENAATSYAFAAGRRAKANHTGAFVWADSTDADFASTGNNQFLIRAAGGVGIGVTKPAARLHVHGDYNNTGAGGFLLDATDDGNPERYALRINPFAVDGSAVGYQFQTKSVSGGINVPLTFNHAGQVGIGNTAPGNLLVVGTGGAYCNGTTWVNGSDRNAKKDFSPVSPQEVLAKISALPITEWQYKADADGIKHVGPMAQDFHAAFSLNGADDTHIATVDEAGVALAAIQGLNEKVESGKRKAETRIQKLEAENAELRQSLEELKQVVGKLSHHQN
ncbi:MAG TPA: tail fiber domain-containing protein, partial [Candidatus Dormibacteraeota bacterium]|nr:tail fiber domain-containing protein [Candidatus Dormibacteraeota bacterium]